MIVGKTLVCVALIVGGGVGVLNARQQQMPDAPPVRAAVVGPDDPSVRTTYRLGADDRITIQISDVPDISGKPQRLDPNGDLKLAMIGRVHAAGLTLAQLETELTNRLKVYVHEPDVSVSVLEFRSQPVSVIGAVGTAGVRQLEGRKTLIEVLSLAGGASQDAGPTLRITRQLDEGPIPLPNTVKDGSGGFSIADVDLKALLDGRSPELNIVVQPHDVISIPRAEVVFVIGEVGKPGPVALSGGNSVSVMEAVASAGGALRTAASGNARILRRASGKQKRTEMAIDLKQMMAGKANDLTLEAGDILIVPGSNGKRAATRVLEAALQAGVMIGTYGLVR